MLPVAGCMLAIYREEGGRLAYCDDSEKISVSELELQLMTSQKMFMKEVVTLDQITS
jgi:hypothetical protein